MYLQHIKNYAYIYYWLIKLLNMTVSVNWIEEYLLCEYSDAWYGLFVP